MIVKNRQRFKFIIFDFDGTLINSKRDIADSVLATLKDLKLPAIPDDIIYGAVGIGIEHLLKSSIKASAAKNYDISHVLSLFRGHYSANLLKNTLPYPGVIDGLQELKGVGLAVLSNKSKVFVDMILDGLNMSNYFIYSFGGDSFSKKKPDPIAIDHIYKKQGIEKNSMLIVGDSGIDIETGKKAGIKTCGVTYGYRDKVELKQNAADCIIDSFEEVIKYIKKA